MERQLKIKIKSKGKMMPTEWTMLEKAMEMLYGAVRRLQNLHEAHPDIVNIDVYECYDSQLNAE